MYAAFDASSQKSAMWLDDATVRTLDSQCLDRDSHPHEARQSAVGDKPASKSRALQMARHDSEAAWCSGDRKHCKFLQRNQANFVSRGY